MKKKKIRDRPIDYKKPFLVIKDLSKEKLKANNEQLIELNNIEKDLKKVLEYYDKKKKIEIPKTKIINEKNDKINNYFINNNIIYKDENSNNINHNNNEYKLNYTLSEYKRPNQYIFYSSSQRQKINSIKKEYEAKEADFIFLKIRENFMTIGELENIIIDLENNVIYNKDDKIDEEKAKNIIETKYSKYKNYADSIINHFKDRRNTIKNSLLRKKWHKDKTFQNRKTDKIKTRKNTQNINESLNKIIEAQELCKRNILPIINNLFLKENLDNHILKLNDYIFLTECDKINNINISENRIQDNNILKEKIEKIAKTLNDKEISDNNIVINENNSNNNKNEINHNNTNNDNLTDKLANDIKKISDSNGTISTNNDSKKNNDRKNQYNKNNNKNNIIFPSLSLDLLKNNNNNNINDSYINNKNNKYRVRIRLNRLNNIVVDRYIQVENDSNPFHDSFNKIINNYKRFNNNEFAINALEKKNFDNLYSNYIFNKVQNLPLDESEEDSMGFNNDMKQFSNSYKQFLKFKRTHT